VASEKPRSISPAAPEQAVTVPREPTWSQAAFSVLAAMFGVQNSKNREHDFSSRSPLKFLVMGVVMASLFVLLLGGIVKLILWQAGAG
jgi:hypothetical protein